MKAGTLFQGAILCGLIGASAPPPGDARAEVVAAVSEPAAEADPTPPGEHPVVVAPQRRPAALDAEAAAVAVTARPLPEAMPAGFEGSAIALRSDYTAFGGLSALAVTPDGASLLLLGDRGALFRAEILREDGALVGLGAVRRVALTPPPSHRGTIDAEGLAIAPDGDLILSLEGPSRLWRLRGGVAETLPAPPGFAAHQPNSGLEALAMDAEGVLYTAPERSGALDRPFPVHRRSPDGRWDVGALRRRPPHLPTGADVGPDGALYIVERDFALLSGGFSWRLSRVDLAGWPALSPVTLAAVDGGLVNAEGLSIWRDGEGRLRALLIADDNFSTLQPTALIELVLPDR